MRSGARVPGDRLAQHPGDKPIDIASLKGEVTLVDFWTYSRINCQRDVPHAQAWYAAGLKVVGVHSPELAFERDTSNIRAGAKSLGVTYPIAIDNKLATWTAYRNQYWPALYLIDATGTVRHINFGEGNYQQTETHAHAVLGGTATVTVTDGGTTKTIKSPDHPGCTTWPPTP